MRSARALTPAFAASPPPPSAVPACAWRGGVPTPPPPPAPPPLLLPFTAAPPAPQTAALPTTNFGDHPFELNMSSLPIMMHSFAAQAAHIAEVNPGAATASAFVRYFDYTGPLNVSLAVPPPASRASRPQAREAPAHPTPLPREAQAHTTPLPREVQAHTPSPPLLRR